jgi:putative hemolysin
VIGIALALGIVGLLLSGFFSGSETGFYRATRLRLVLDAVAGDHVSRGLLWLTRHPSLFVATTLVGNNLANYLTSLAIVMFTQVPLFHRSQVASMVAPLILSPLVFVLGELLPKQLFLKAPNRLLRRAGPLFLVFVVLFFPVSALLWGLNRVLAGVVRRSPEELRFRLARRELRRALEEGHEAGILYDSQRQLARGVLAESATPVAQFVEPSSRLPCVTTDTAPQEALAMARRYQVAALPVASPERPDDPIGYVRAIELGLRKGDRIGPWHRMLDVPRATTHLVALVRMQAAGESLARVVDDEGQTVGLVTMERLREPLLHATMGRAKENR